MIRKRLLTLLVALATLLTFLPQSGFAMVIEDKEYIYVSTTGTENGDGTIDNPFATITEARDKIRALKAQGVAPAQGFVVYLRGGNYSLTEGIVFTEEDSGTETAPIVYRSYPGEKAVILGGASLPADKFEKVTDEAILNRIIDEGSRSKLLQIDLKALGYTNFGPYYLRGGYSYRNPVPNNRPKYYPPELVVDDKLLTLAQYPNSGNMTVQSVIKAGYSGGVKNSEMPVESFVISPADKRIEKWTEAENAIMHGFWRYDWADQAMFIKNIDVKGNTLEPNQGSIYGILQGQSFYVYNLIEEIDMPGEYFLDHDTGMLYMYPPEGFGKSSNVSLSMLEADAITIKGSSYIDFKGIDFSTLRGSAVVISKGHHIRIMDAEIKYIPVFAIQISKYTQYCGVINCYFHDVDGGVTLYSGIAQDLTPGRSYVENCEFDNYARLTKTYQGAVNISGVENRVSHNEIHEGPHVAIMFGGFDTIVEYNEIYNVLKQADDMAAIYTGQTWLHRGQQVRYNYVHDIVSESGQGAGAHAVYIDDCQNEVSVYGNIIENLADGAAFFINGGRYNNFINNIVINSGRGVQLCYSNSWDNVEAGRVRLLNTIYNSAHWDDPSTEPWNQDIFKERYPKMHIMMNAEDMATPTDNVMKNNVFISTQPTYYIGKTTGLLEESNNLVINKDPGFYDMARRNYNLKEDSLVYKEIPDFITIPFARMGRINNRALYRVKDAVVLSLNTPFALRNNELVKIDPDNLMVAPKLIGDRTFVPIRFIAEALGAEVSYDSETKGVKIKLDNTTLEMTIDSASALKNGEAITLENAPIIDENRTLVPLREVSNLFNKKVFWDDIGLIAISDSEDIFNPQNDSDIISFLHNHLTIY